MIKLENVNKYFNYHKKNEIHVIDNTSLEFEEKSLVALLGESGSGKTTLLNTIGGLDNVTSGNIYIRVPEQYQFDSYILEDEEDTFLSVNNYRGKPDRVIRALEEASELKDVELTKDDLTKAVQYSKKREKEIV